MSNPFKSWIKELRRTQLLLERLQKMPAQLEQLTLAMDDHRREMRLLHSFQTLPDRALWDGQPPMIPGRPGGHVFPHGTVCRQDSFETPWFSYWSKRLDEGLRYHRKLWEFVFICQSLWERGAIVSGARGLGFGVGSEPLSAYFASQNCRITATDMEVERAEEMGWTMTNEHATGKAALRKPAVCADRLFEENVTFQTCDMNHIPDTLSGFDFCWSACALEHLGSIEKGIEFVERSVQCLKPGGWAVHTTEYNYGSNIETLDNMDTVLFRRQDLERMAQRLTEQGHKVAAFDLEMGGGPIDQYLDVMPYREQPHLRMALWGYAATSVGIIVQRGDA